MRYARQTLGPDRKRSPVEWGNFLSVCLFVRLSVRPPQPGWEALRLGLEALRPGWEALRSGWEVLRSGWEALRPGWEAHRPGWEAIRPLN